MEKYENLKLEEIRFVETIAKEDGTKVISVVYYDNSTTEIEFDMYDFAMLKERALNNESNRKLKAREAERAKKATKDPDNKDQDNKDTKAEPDDTNTKDGENQTKTEDKKSKLGKGLVLATTGILTGVLVGVGINSCSLKETDDEVKTISKNIESNNDETNTVVEDADMKNTYISYEDFVALVDRMDSEVDKILDMDIDKESYLCYLIIANLDNLEQETIDKLIATYNLPTNGQDLVVKAFPVFDNIAQQNYNYMNNLENVKVSYAQYIVDDDDKPLLDQIDSIVEEVREIDGRYENGTLTDADKARTIQIYEELDSYLRSQNKGPIDNRNNYNASAAKVADFSIPTIEGVLAYDGFINQNQVNAHTGSHIDPSDGEKMLNTSIHDWADIIKLWDKCGNMVAEIVKENTQTYGGLTAEEVQAYRAAYAQQQAPTVEEQQAVRMHHRF